MRHAARRFLGRWISPAWSASSVNRNIGQNLKSSDVARRGVELSSILQNTSSRHEAATPSSLDSLLEGTRFELLVPLWLSWRKWPRMAGSGRSPEHLIRTNEGKEFDDDRNPHVARPPQGHPRPRPDAVRGRHDLHRGARLDGCRHRQGGAAARRSRPHRLRRRLLFHDVQRQQALADRQPQRRPRPGIGQGDGEEGGCLHRELRARRG